MFLEPVLVQLKLRGVGFRSKIVYLDLWIRYRITSTQAYGMAAMLLIEPHAGFHEVNMLLAT